MAPCRAHTSAKAADDTHRVIQCSQIFCRRPCQSKHVERASARAAPSELIGLRYSIGAFIEYLTKPEGKQHFCKWQIRMVWARAPLPTSALWKFIWRKLHFQQNVQFFGIGAIKNTVAMNNRLIVIVTSLFIYARNHGIKQHKKA